MDKLPISDVFSLTTHPIYHLKKNTNQWEQPLQFTSAAHSGLYQAMPVFPFATL